MGKARVRDNADEAEKGNHEALYKTAEAYLFFMNKSEEDIYKGIHAVTQAFICGHDREACMTVCCIANDKPDEIFIKKELEDRKKELELGTITQEQYDAIDIFLNEWYHKYDDRDDD